jgi:hypothetical protein
MLDQDQLRALNRELNTSHEDRIYWEVKNQTQERPGLLTYTRQTVCCKTSNFSISTEFSLDVIEELPKYLDAVQKQVDLLKQFYFVCSRANSYKNERENEEARAKVGGPILKALQEATGLKGTWSRHGKSFSFRTHESNNRGSWDSLADATITAYDKLSTEGNIPEACLAVIETHKEALEALGKL